MDEAFYALHEPNVMNIPHWEPDTKYAAGAYVICRACKSQTSTPFRCLQEHKSDIGNSPHVYVSASATWIPDASTLGGFDLKVVQPWVENAKFLKGVRVRVESSDSGKLTHLFYKATQDHLASMANHPYLALRLPYTPQFWEAQWTHRSNLDR